MDALGVLKQEHVLILKRVQAVEETAMGLSKSELADRQKLTEALLEDCKIAWQEIFQHIRNEEEALFPTLEQNLNEGDGLVQVMRAEHGELLGTMISLLGEIVKGVGHTDRVLTSDFTRRVGEFRQALSEHVEREDKILFWMADLHLTPSDRRRVSLELAEVSRPSGDSRLS